MKSLIQIITVSVILFLVQCTWGQNPNTVDGSSTGISKQASTSSSEQSMIERTNSWDPAGNNLPAPVRKKTPEEIAGEADYLRAKSMINLPENYKSFLKDGNMHLARIFADRNCGKKQTAVVSVEELSRCADAVPLPGNGSIYSFRLKSSLILMEWQDIHFINKKFVAGNKFAQGIISDIGDVSLEDVNLTSTPFKFLVDYKSETSAAAVQKQIDRLKNKINANGYEYSISAPLVLNHTYALRSTAYRLKNVLTTDKRVDIIVVFRVIGQEKDGSLILLWKKLKETSSPILN